MRSITIACVGDRPGVAGVLQRGYLFNSLEVMMRIAMTALALVLAAGSAPVLAANARHPYSNVDKRVDHGGDTGDSRVEALNQQQLDAARAANGPSGTAAPMMGAPLMTPGAAR